MAPLVLRERQDLREVKELRELLVQTDLKELRVLLVLKARKGQ
jgi:hypothetical protein